MGQQLMGGDVAEGGIDVGKRSAGGVLEPELAAGGEAKNRGGRHHFGRRADAEQMIGSDGFARFDVRDAEAVLVYDAAVVDGDPHQTGDLLPVALFLCDAGERGGVDLRPEAERSKEEEEH